MSAPLTTGMDQMIEEACARLRAAGHRITQPRIGMLKAMIRRPEPRPLEMIHQDVEGACDLVTVYRSMATMEQIGLVRRIFSRSGVGLYQLELRPERYHIITSDGQVTALEDTMPSPEMRLAIQAVEDRLRAAGFTSVSHVVEFFTTKAADGQFRPASGSAGEYISGL